MKYNHYYTASDVTVLFYSRITDKYIQLDKMTAIAYSHNISSIPIYTLGTLDPYFFSVGNSLVQGQFDLAFSDSKYLRAVINDLLDSGDYYSTSTAVKTNPFSNTDERKTTIISKKTWKEMTAKELQEYSAQQDIRNARAQNRLADSILKIPREFDIIIRFNNANSNMDGSASDVTIKGVKITAEARAVSSSDDTALVDRYTFMAKNISSSSTLE